PWSENIVANDEQSRAVKRDTIDPAEHQILVPGGNKAFLIRGQRMAKNRGVAGADRSDLRVGSAVDHQRTGLRTAGAGRLNEESRPRAVQYSDRPETIEIRQRLTFVADAEKRFGSHSLRPPRRIKRTDHRFDGKGTDRLGPQWLALSNNSVSDGELIRARRFPRPAQVARTGGQPLAPHSTLGPRVRR